MEIWKPIPGYESLYEVSNTGKVKGLKRDLEKKQKIVTNYYRVQLSKENKTEQIRVHQLVAMAFLNHVRNGNTLVVDHIDGNKLNNNLDNLRVIPERKNNSSKKTVNFDFPKGVSQQRNGRYKASICIEGKRIYLGDYNTPEEAGQAYQQKLLSL